MSTGTKLTDTGTSHSNRSRSPRSARAFVLGVFVLALFHVCSAIAGDYVLVVDVSGSMLDNVAKRDKRVRIEVVQDALRQYLPALPAGSRVHLMAFGTGILSEEELVLTNSAGVNRALAWVDGLTDVVKKNNNTYLWTSLRRALQIASEYSTQNPDQTVTVRVLTDGEDNEKATTLDEVLKEFQPVLDGTKIRSNLVILGDLEFKTKLNLPEGAFETTQNTTWEDIFPPIVMWAPEDPEVGQDVRLFENDTRSVYRSYAWQIGGVTQGTEKVLTWRFTNSGVHKVTLGTTGLKGNRVSSTVIVRVREPAQLDVDIVSPIAQPETDQDVVFVSRCSREAFAQTWRVNSNEVSSDKDLRYRFAQPGEYEISLTARDLKGVSGTTTLRIHVVEKAKPVAPVAAFRVMTQTPKVGFLLELVDDSTGPVDSWYWEINGSLVGTTRILSIKPPKAGQTLVQLTVRGPGGESVARRQIDVAPQYVAPVALVSATPTRGTVPLTVQFTNRISGDYRSFHWNFGDGIVSTNASPQRVFSVATNHLVTLTVIPMDSAFAPLTEQITIRASAPLPIWARAAIPIVPGAVLLGLIGVGIRRRQRIALRLPVYYWAEQSSVCQTAMMTRADQSLDLSPTAPIRVARQGKTPNLVIQPLEGATLYGVNGEESLAQSVGDGVRVTARMGAGPLRAVAISPRQKPRKPSPAEAAPAEAADAVCGLLIDVDEPVAVSEGELDWGWGK